MNEANNLQTPTQPPLVIADVSRCPSSIVYLEDCVQGLKRFADKYFDLAIVDPPYGLDLANMNMGVGKSKRLLKFRIGNGSQKTGTKKPRQKNILMSFSEYLKTKLFGVETTLIYHRVKTI